MAHIAGPEKIYGMKLLKKITQNHTLLTRVYSFSDKHPHLKTFLRRVNRRTLNVQRPSPISFTGWGMTTQHALPWDDEHDWLEFRQAMEDAERLNTDLTADQLSTLAWRHWVVMFAVRHSLRFAQRDPATLPQLVECGVQSGLTAFFSLRETDHLRRDSGYEMHLYDSWGPMRASELLESEKWNVGRYSDNSLDVTKENLREFENHTVYHVGYIPEIFESKSDHPKGPVIYLSIDLNSAGPTVGACDFFLPRMPKAGVILFDDYGNPGYRDTKLHLDKYLADQSGDLLKLPTGQAIFFVGGQRGDGPVPRESA